MSLDCACHPQRLCLTENARSYVSIPFQTVGSGAVPAQKPSFMRRDPKIGNRSSLQWLRRIVNSLEDAMNNRLVVSLIAAALLAPGAAFAQSTTAQGAADGAAAGGQVGGPIGAMVGGTVGAAVGAAAEIPNAVITGLPRDRSVVVQERVVVGEPLPPAVELRTVPQHTEYSYAVVNDRRVIVEPRTRRVVRIID